MSEAAKKIIAEVLNEFDTDDFVQPEFIEAAAHKIVSQLEWSGFRIIKMERAPLTDGNTK